MKKSYVFGAVLGMAAAASQAALVINEADARSWQGANVGTFAQLFYGSNTQANRQQVVTNQLMDDSNFDATGYTSGSLIRYNGTNINGGNAGSLGTYGSSRDQANVNNGADQGTFNYDYNGVGAKFGGDNVDQHWIQTDNTIGNTIWDLGFQATKAAVFNTIDHGPLPQEAIESTVYLSNDKINWTQAVTERVWMEGIYSDTSVVWDGFVYAVGTGTSATFRYASVIWGGPGSLINDGDNEINAIMGLNSNFGGNVPEPGSLALVGLALAAAGVARRRRA
jgi:hypothetical protein